MKKNISINISGIIFHIEEDGYENLKKYLDSINKYFSSFEDSSEILADIESRIAEIFLSKLNEEKQVISAEDVHALVTTMGSVSDFKAAENEDFTNKEEPSKASSASPPEPGTESGSSSSYSSKKYAPPKSLMRDQRRKILGGVCSGIANFMNVDAVWVRLFFALFAFAYGITFFAYIFMWIIVPGSYELEEPEVEKKFFRDPQRKVIGGVAGGLAAYLGMDLTIVRVLFVILTVFGGVGFFIYVVLWIVLPEARTLTDKMQMQGEAVTLSNIESTIKKNQEEPREESTATKILMFPFRLIGMILSALAKIVVPILEVIRVAIGIVIVLIGLSLIFGVIVSGAALLGIFSTGMFSTLMLENGDMSMPIDVFTRAFPGWVVFAAFLGSLVPSLFIVLLGVSVVAKRIVFSAVVGWSLFVLFFISVILLGVGIPRIIYAFKEHGEVRKETTYQLAGKVARLEMEEVGLDDFHGLNPMTLKGYNGKDFKLVQEFMAQGSTRQKAIENTEMVQYNVVQRDSVLVFDSNLTFKPDAVFRGQHLDMILYIPYDRPFTMDAGISDLIRQYIGEYEEDKVWKISEARGLECVGCPEPEADVEDNADLRDFDAIKISGKFDVRINRGDQYAVEITGPEREKSKYTISRSGETLIINYQNEKKFNFKLKDIDAQEVQITVTLPNLEQLEAIGYGSIWFDEFQVDDLDIDIEGPVEVKGEVHGNNLSIAMKWASVVDLSGSVQQLNAELDMASVLKAYNLDAVNARIEASGASTAKVTVTGELEIEERLSSTVDYRGNPRDVVKRD